LVTEVVPVTRVVHRTEYARQRQKVCVCKPVTRMVERAYHVCVPVTRTQKRTYQVATPVVRTEERQRPVTYFETVPVTRTMQVTCYTPVAVQVAVCPPVGSGPCAA